MTTPEKCIIWKIFGFEARSQRQFLIGVHLIVVRMSNSNWDDETYG